LFLADTKTSRRFVRISHLNTLTLAGVRSLSQHRSVSTWTRTLSQHRSVSTWTPFPNTEVSVLGRILLGRAPDRIGYPILSGLPPNPYYPIDSLPYPWTQHRSVANRNRALIPFPTPKCQYLAVYPFQNTAKCQYLGRVPLSSLRIG
jgi:hypothetical protein